MTVKAKYVQYIPVTIECWTLKYAMKLIEDFLNLKLNGYIASMSVSMYSMKLELS
jgi:hypothetical protein